jgi:hemolysin III
VYFSADTDRVGLVWTDEASQLAGVGSARQNGPIESLTSASAARPRDVPLGTTARPLWRGRLHVFALFAAVPALAVLIGVSRNERARIAVSIYAFGLCSMFVASSTYHRWVHTLRARELWRRLDHAMIFAAIGGSITPVCLLGVPEPLGLWLLAMMWVGCLFGVGIKLTAWRHQRVAGGIMYFAISSVAVVAIPAMWVQSGAATGVLMIVCGVFYTAGAIGLNRRWPRLRPAVFGYHEVWHAFTVIAASAHLVVVWMLAT